jgi:hypothetical protein
MGPFDPYPAIPLHQLGSWLDRVQSLVNQTVRETSKRSPHPIFVPWVDQWSQLLLLSYSLTVVPSHYCLLCTLSKVLDLAHFVRSNYCSRHSRLGTRWGLALLEGHKSIQAPDEGLPGDQFAFTK